MLQHDRGRRRYIATERRPQSTLAGKAGAEAAARGQRCQLTGTVHLGVDTGQQVHTKSPPKKSRAAVAANAAGVPLFNPQDSWCHASLAASRPPYLVPRRRLFCRCCFSQGHVLLCLSGRSRALAVAVLPRHRVDSTGRHLQSCKAASMFAAAEGSIDAACMMAACHDRHGPRLCGAVPQTGHCGCDRFLCCFPVLLKAPQVAIGANDSG